MPLVPDPKNCDISVKRAIQGLSKKLGYTGNPAFASLTLSDLVASRLIAADSGKTFKSVEDLAVWILGTENQIIVTGANGKVTLSTPQDIHKQAQMELAGITIKNGSGNIIFHVNHDELYFTEYPTDPVTGNPIGLLLALTYTV